MAKARICSECPNSLAGRGPKATTCSPRCRSRRARRKATEFEAAPETTKDAMAYLAMQNVDQALARVTEKELVPVVREAITEDVYRAIQSLIGLTPQVVAALAEDLDSEDPLVRSKAMALALKYTVGHPALTDKEATAAPAQMVVSFALPRPDDVDIDGVYSDVTDEEADWRTCDMCHLSKPPGEFVGASDRCFPCVANWKATIESQFLTP